MKYYCSHCHITHKALVSQDDETGDETYEFCPTCKNDMYLIAEGQEGFIDGATGIKKKIAVSNNSDIKSKRWKSEQDHQDWLRIKENKEDEWIEEQLKKQKNA